ncbi:Enoyl-CoA hydratase/carnithine racemase [Gulbenkiania indica]|uniref:Enoyl-CoA hydratase/carnithine racemase n=1 Tax=Gulbenkiania indica TaxID=375574 RepID=A0A0K6H1L5_9NEIS|nr:crotonase/enoyl-CoA hydratase family protein [Gulbenkiania indica]CUA84780.1 Enoyl-CoA hydratase/carnithine racemase [Gulbenkiania indica]
MDYTTLTVKVEEGVAQVTLNRPDKSNALNEAMWQDIKAAFDWCDAEPTVRVVVLSGSGRHFCAGIDLSMLMGMNALIEERCDARKREKLRRIIIGLQDSVSSLERCRKPVVAAIQGACVGGGLDVVLAADFRYASEDAVFGVREVDVALVADVGSLQRLPRVVGEGVAREMALTGRDVTAQEALSVRLVNRLFPSAEATLEAALEAARLIASKSPVAVRGTKEVLNYSRDHSVDDGLRYVATWNAGMLISEDIQQAAMAAMTRQSARFRD